MTWEHCESLSMTPANFTFNIVINKEALDCFMFYSDNIKRRMNMYRDEVERVVRLGEIKDEDGDSDNN